MKTRITPEYWQRLHSLEEGGCRLAHPLRAPNYPLALAKLVPERGPEVFATRWGFGVVLRVQVAFATRFAIAEMKVSCRLSQPFGGPELRPLVPCQSHEQCYCFELLQGHYAWRSEDVLNKGKWNSGYWSVEDSFVGYLLVELDDLPPHPRGSFPIQVEVVDTLGRSYPYTFDLKIPILLLDATAGPCAAANAQEGP